MGWITLVLYLGVVVIWALMARRYFQTRDTAPKSTLNNLIIMTLVVAVLTVLQIMGLRQ